MSHSRHRQQQSHHVTMTMLFVIASTTLDTPLIVPFRQWCYQQKSADENMPLFLLHLEVVATNAK